MGTVGEKVSAAAGFQKKGNEEEHVAEAAMDSQVGKDGNVKLQIKKQGYDIESDLTWEVREETTIMAPDVLKEYCENDKSGDTISSEYVVATRKRSRLPQTDRPTDDDEIHISKYRRVDGDDPSIGVGVAVGRTQEASGTAEEVSDGEEHGSDSDGEEHGSDRKDEESVRADEDSDVLDKDSDGKEGARRRARNIFASFATREPAYSEDHRETESSLETNVKAGTLGRPSKTKKLSVSQEDENDLQDQVIRRGRGRPRKTDITTSSRIDPGVPDSATPKRGRGRPPKVRDPSSSVPINSTNQGNRGRARPRKKEDSPSPLYHEPNSETSATKLRGPGRPRRDETPDPISEYVTSSGESGAIKRSTSQPRKVSSFGTLVEASGADETDAVKRGPGRLRKRLQKDTSLAQLTFLDDITDTDEEGKKENTLGRSRKDLSPATASEYLKSTENSVVAKWPPSHPRMGPGVLASPGSLSSRTYSLATSAKAPQITDNVTVTPKRGRGRPRKKTDPASSSPRKAAPPPNGDVRVVKRGRGRPSKRTGSIASGEGPGTPGTSVVKRRRGRPRKSVDLSIPLQSETVENMDTVEDLS